MLAVGNTLMSLKVGVWDSGQLTASLLTFALLTPLMRALKSALSQDANNLAQAMAASVASMPATMGLLAAVPALSLLGHEPSNTALLLSGWAFGALGIAAGWLLAPMLLGRDALPFPTAIAAAELIQTIHASGDEARRRTRPFLAAFLFAATVTLVRDTSHALPSSFAMAGIASCLVFYAIGVVFAAFSGAIFGALYAFFYNVIANWAGGLRIELAAEQVIMIEKPKPANDVDEFRF